MIRLTTFAGQSVAVFGLGQSGTVSARALMAGGASVAAWDDNDESRKRAEEHAVPIVDLTQADWCQFSALVLAPGVPLTHPQPHWTVARACEAGVEVIGDIELFGRQRAKDCPGAPVIAITGTNGKSTTTALVAHLLKCLGMDVQMGGNIGRPVLDLEPLAANRFYVIEVSSYQIDLAPTCAPSVGVLLNITPDHLDRHGTIENYAAVKHRLLQSSDAAVIGVDDDWSRAAIEKVGSSRRLYPFTVGKGSGVVPRFYAIGATLFMHESLGAHASSRELATLDRIASLRGAHNVQNALAALAALRALQDWFDDRAQSEDEKDSIPHIWDVEKLRKGLSTFPGLPHRLEEVGSVGPVVFVNDSKATNAIATEMALNAFDRNIYWILGGRAKEGGIDMLAPSFGRVAKAYLIGEASDAFAKTLAAHNVVFERCETLRAAATASARDAISSEQSDAVVLLSPACASFDQFKNFEVRGETFRELVGELDNVEMSGS